MIRMIVNADPGVGAISSAMLKLLHEYKSTENDRFILVCGHDNADLADRAIRAMEPLYRITLVVLPPEMIKPLHWALARDGSQGVWSPGAP